MIRSTSSPVPTGTVDLVTTTVKPETAGATLRYLPKYSPDLNPIELPYSKFKAYLRKLAARTIPSIHRAIRSFLHILKPRECAHYYAGYAAI
jgi:transposase